MNLNKFELSKCIRSQKLIIHLHKQEHVGKTFNFFLQRLNQSEHVSSTNLGTKFRLLYLPKPTPNWEALLASNHNIYRQFPLPIGRKCLHYV